MSGRMGLLAAAIAAGLYAPNTGAKAGRARPIPGKTRSKTYRKRDGIKRLQENERRRRQIEAGVLRVESRGVRP